MLKYISGLVIGFMLAVAVGASLVHWGPYFLTTDAQVQEIDAQTMFLLSNLNACAAAYSDLFKKSKI